MATVLSRKLVRRALVGCCILVGPWSSSVVLADQSVQVAKQASSSSFQDVRDRHMLVGLQKEELERERPGANRLLKNCTDESIGELERFVAVRVSINRDNLDGSNLDDSNQLSSLFVELSEGLEAFLEVSELAYNIEASRTCSRNNESGTDRKRQANEIQFLPQFTSMPIVSSGEIEVILRFVSSCPGCNASISGVFSETEELLTADLDERLEIGNSDVDEECGEICPAPSKQSFVDTWNKILDVAPLATSVSIISVEELLASPNNPACKDFFGTDENNSEAASEFTTFLAVRLDFYDQPETPSDIAVQSLRQALQDAYVDQNSATAGVCDPSRRQLLSITVEDINTHTRRRRLQANDQDMDRRRLQTRGLSNFELGVEVLFRVEASCLDCGGKLLENSEAIISDLEERPCICPVNSGASGVGIVPLTKALTSFSSSFAGTVSEVSEVVPVDCPAEELPFTSIVLVEYNLKEGAALPTTEEINTLQSGFVAAFNLIAHMSCDPFFRKARSAQLVRSSGVVSPFALEGETVTLEFEVSGSCRGCDPEDITLYDSTSTMTGILEGGSRRLYNLSRNLLNKQGANGQNEPHLRGLQQDSGGDSTCYCNVQAVENQGPSEVEVISAYSDLIQLLDLPNIAGVADCKVLTLFSSSVILSFQGDAKNITESELLALGKGFIDSYNQVNSEDEVCDRQFRRLREFQVNADIELNEEFLESGGLSDSNQKNVAQRRLQLSKKVVHRREQDITVPIGVLSTEPSSSPFPSNSPSKSPFPTTSFSPSSVTESPTETPTSVFNTPTEIPTSIFDIDSSINILVSVQGTCRGCSNDRNLFNQVSDRRRLQEPVNGEQSMGDFDFGAKTGSCFCPFGAIQGSPSEEQVLEVYEETVIELKEAGEVVFVEEVQELEEVTVVQCVFETNAFDTSVVVDFLGFFDEVNEADLEAIRTTFSNTYNRLSQDYCDELFRRTRELGNIEFRQLSGADETGRSRIRFILSIVGQCRDCEDESPLFSGPSAAGSTRKLQDEELCFCDSNSLGLRTPSGDEFLVEYVDVWEALAANRDLRRLQDGSDGPFSLTAPIFVGSEEPLTDSPSSLPSTSPVLLPANSQPSTGNSSAEPSSQSGSPIVSPGGTAEPSNRSNSPSNGPSDNPSFSPSDNSGSPSAGPSGNSSVPPSSSPSEFPSLFPSTFPSSFPSTFPSSFPSAFPSSFPSSFPSKFPSVFPSSFPSTAPSAFPSSFPSPEPSQQPSWGPSLSPSDQPTKLPSSAPSEQPSEMPSPNQPSSLPSISFDPSISPSSSPSSSPTKQCETGDLATVLTFCETGNCCQGAGGAIGAGCNWNAALVNTVCRDSCNGSNACNWENTVQGVLVEQNACVGDNACTFWIGINHIIRENACVGTGACADWDGDSNTIEDSGCVGDAACQSWSDGGHVIGTAACRNGSSCRDWQGANNSIGANSCFTFAPVPQACRNWLQGGHTVGVNSCTSSTSNTVPCEGWAGVDYVIGDNSCFQSQACRSIDADEFNVGNTACRGAQACQGIGGPDPGTVSVGNGACVGDDSCQAVGTLSTVAVDVGASACTGDRSCQEVQANSPEALTIAPSACPALESCQNTLSSIAFDFAGFATIDATCTGTLCKDCLANSCVLPTGESIISSTVCQSPDPCAALGGTAP